jgi:hypothetical protein
MKVPQWALWLMTLNGLIFFNSGRQNTHNVSETLLLVAVSIGLGFGPVFLLRNENGIRSFFSMRAMREVDATPPEVVRMIGWILLFVITSLALFIAIAHKKL